ncbi:MAG: aldo/keto reductase [Ktedonobacteraceae bacterium]|nr:aldo/keto reductase [Ktedonobacteraceae bacterium]
MKMNEYVTLGRSGLCVSPLCLGTMTFGTEWGWGADDSTSAALFDLYLSAGGNFFDTADFYTEGKSEEILGKLIHDRKVRDRVVLATKFTFNKQPGNPNAGGNGRKNVYSALEGSLRRLSTEYVDLYWMHAWDVLTPIDEVLATFDSLVNSGKIRYYGFSNVPAWYASRVQTIAECEGKARAIALQLEYSLVERNIEREHVPAARELGMGLCPWSPLASGFLSGKYSREPVDVETNGRLKILKDSGNPAFEKFTDRNWRILSVLLEVAKELNRTPAEVALNWVATQPGVSSTIIGATSLPQLETNLAAIQLEIPNELRSRLTMGSDIDEIYPYVFFGSFFQTWIKGGVQIHPWSYYK